MARTITIGSRGSSLALWQAGWVKDRLERLQPQHTYKIRVIKTKGDKILDVALAKIGDKGLFTKELEEALLAGEVDLAVHSLKDVPTALPAGLKLGAVCERHNPADVLVAGRGARLSLETLRPGARIGTSSLRRRAQLLHYRRDLEIVDVRGNLNTRLGKLAGGGLDALVLAAAGVERLGEAELVQQVIPFELLLPAVGQGSLAVEVRGQDDLVGPLLAHLNNREAELATAAERSFLAVLGGGCQVPIGALAEVQGSAGLRLSGLVASLDGSTLIRETVAGPADRGEALGRELAARLRERGAEAILQSIERGSDT